MYRETIMNQGQNQTLRHKIICLGQMKEFVFVNQSMDFECRLDRISIIIWFEEFEFMRAMWSEGCFKWFFL